MHHQYNDVGNQQDATIFRLLILFKSALKVSGDRFADLQEHYFTVYTTFGIMHRHCCRPVPRLKWNSAPSQGGTPPPGYRTGTSWVHYTTSCNTQSSAPEDGQDQRPKHVELTGIINKPLLLHLVGCLYYLYK